MATREFLERTRKTLRRDGQLLEASFLQLRLDRGLEKADPERVRELRRAFLSGAQCVYSIITGPASSEERVLRQLKLREEIGRFLVELMREQVPNMPKLAEFDGDQPGLFDAAVRRGRHDQGNG
jgi:hypothetical protein